MTKFSGTEAVTPGALLKATHQRVRVESLLRVAAEDRDADRRGGLDLLLVELPPHQVEPLAGRLGRPGAGVGEGPGPVVGGEGADQGLGPGLMPGRPPAQGG